MNVFFFDTWGQALLVIVQLTIPSETIGGLGRDSKYNLLQLQLTTTNVKYWKQLTT